MEKDMNVDEISNRLANNHAEVTGVSQLPQLFRDAFIITRSRASNSSGSIRFVSSNKGTTMLTGDVKPRRWRSIINFRSSPKQERQQT
jgi:hypothetical protein